ncbi:molybdopterin-binding oxidoreductase, partial [Streptomyces sp. NPDC035033]
MTSFRNHLSRLARGALAGLTAGYAALAAAELTAALVRPAAGPVTVVGGAVVDRTPAPVKDFAIRTFGENDKAVLQLGIVVLLALCATGLGIVASRHRRAGALGVLAFGAVGAAAALTRPDSAGLGDALPSLTGAAAGAAVLFLLTGGAFPADGTARADGAGPEAEGPRTAPPRQRGRRRFLTA